MISFKDTICNSGVGGISRNPNIVLIYPYVIEKFTNTKYDFWYNINGGVIMARPYNIDYNKVYSSSNYGDFVFLEEIEPYRYINSNGKSLTKQRRARIKFLLTGTVMDVLIQNAMKGDVRDPYYPKICGVACIGNTYGTGDHESMYNRWRSMISRCYNTNHKSYKYYKNCTVAPEWLCFENFIKSVPYLPGYQDMINNPDVTYSIDKDILQPGIVNKVYSPQTCMWIPLIDNVNEEAKRVDKTSTSSKYYGISLHRGKYEVLPTVRTPYGPVGMFDDEIAAVNMREYCRENYPQIKNPIPNTDYPNMSMSQALSHRGHGRKKVKQMYSLVDVDDK